MEKDKEPKANAPWWQCSGCGLVIQGNVGRCKGYCFDDTGSSCDGVPCPNCKRFHFWSGSIAPQDIARARAVLVPPSTDSPNI